MEPVKLYMLLLGCKPVSRNTEQHDVFFSIGKNVSLLVPEIIAFWPEANQKLHLDAWREVTQVDDYDITITGKENRSLLPVIPGIKLYFINLGGYKPGMFEEFHYKMLVAAKNKNEAIRQASRTAFYRHTGFEGASSHIDDRYGIDMDEGFEISEILPTAIKEKYTILITKRTEPKPDTLHLGYLKLERLARLDL